MKHIYLTPLLASVLLCACSDEIGTPLMEVASQNTGVTYPKAFTTKASSLETNWENIENVLTATGLELKLPWNPNNSDANIPKNIACDIKKEDGWEFIFHTLKETDASANKRLYMGFYNIRTGVLKVFYYLLETYAPNNGGIWSIDFNGGNELLNFTPEIADYISNKQTTNWSCTNITKNSSKAFLIGWNCFTVPLAYTNKLPSNLELQINPSNLNTINVDLFGTNNSYSQGTILTHGSSNPFSELTGDLASLFGNEANKYLEKTINEKEETKSIIAGGAGVIVKFGLNKIFSKLTASFSQPTVTRSDLEFTTRGVTKTTGTLSFNSSPQVISLNVQLPKDKVGELGSWNLRDMPTVYMDPRANYVPSSDDYYREYWYKLRGVSKYKYDIVINPALQSKIKKYWVDCALIRYWDHTHKDSVKIRPEVPSFYTNFGSLGRRNASGGFNEAIEPENLLYKKFMEKGSIYQTKMQPKIYVKDLYGQYQGPIPVVFVPKVNSYEQHYFDSSNLYLKVTLNTVTEINGKIDTTMSTRTFIPKIEWDPNIYNQLKDVDMKDLVHYNHIK